MVPRVVAEIESASTLTAVIADGLGATILPASMAREVVASCGAWQCRIVEPVIEAPLALCQSDHLPLSEPAQAVKEILLELVAALPRQPARRPERRAHAPCHKPPLSRHRHSVLALLRRAAPLLSAMAMDQQQIKAFIDAMAASDLAEMEFSEDGWTLRLVRRASGTQATCGARATPAPREPAVARMLRPSAASRCGLPKASCGAAVRRRASAAVARRAAFRARRARPSKAGQTLCVIEAMKVFNEVRAERDGTVERSAGHARARKSKPASRCCASTEDAAAMFDTVLIANRGEIALRIQRACRGARPAHRRRAFRGRP